MGKKKYKFLVPLIIILIITGLVIGGIFYFTNIKQQTVGYCEGGTTVLGINKAFITTSNELGGKEVLRIYATSNGGGECLRILFRDYEIENKLIEEGQDYDVTRSIVSGDIFTNSQTQTFTTSEKSQAIYKIGVDEKSEGILCTIDNCEKTYQNTIRAFSLLPGTTCWCVHKNLVGRGGDFDSTSKKDFDVTFFVEDLGTTQLTDSQQSGTIGDKVFIKWTGDLMSGTWLDNPNYDTYFNIADNKWRMTDDGFYDDVSDRLEQDTKETYPPSNNGCLMRGTPDDTKDCANKYNAFVDLKIANKNSEFVNRESSVESVSWNGNKLLTDLATYTTWQTFIIDLDADWVGIQKNTGKPMVQCPSGRKEVISGSQITSIFKVRDEEGTNPSFGLSLTCNEGSGSLQQSRINNVGTSYRDIEGYVTISTTSDKEFSCVFEAYDLNNPNERDSCTSNYLGKEFTGCTKGEKTCSSDGRKLGTCNSEGTDFIWVDCDYGCEAFEDTYRCRLQKNEICDNGIDDDGDGLVDLEDSDCKGEDGECGAWLEIGGVTIIPDLFCIINNFFKKFIIIFSIMAGFVGGLLSGFFTIRLFEREVGNKKWIIFLVVFSVMGISIGLLAFFYFWFIIITLIILGLINLIIKIIK